MKIVLAITGASGSIYAGRLLSYMEKSPEVDKISVVLSQNAIEIYKSETGAQISAGGKVDVYGSHDFSAPFASGSCDYDAMVICPCSMGTLGRVAAGVSDSLITRAADVMMKERRRLILVLRETPYSLVHIRNMETVTLSGGIICPACPSFYSKPDTLEALADTVVFRVLSLLGIPNSGFRWGEK
ncbi:MAG: UbiX family flavin prenyltransferase [Bacteroidales bacterium]|nr:UbiX family flavin prenyltransferase [Bacteroidales bacterium]